MCSIGNKAGNQLSTFPEKGNPLFFRQAQDERILDHYFLLFISHLSKGTPYESDRAISTRAQPQFFMMEPGHFDDVIG